MLKEQKGITLVALIITIIVMLILAGVSISLVVGENGVLTQAQDVNPKQLVASAKEAVALANADIMAAYYSDSAVTTGVRASSPKTFDDILAKINENYSGTDLIEATKNNKGEEITTNPDFDSEDAMPSEDTSLTEDIVLSIPGARFAGDEYKADETITITVEYKKDDGLYTLSVK